ISGAQPVSTSPPDQAQPPTPPPATQKTHPPPPPPPPATMVLSLPRPGPDAPATAWQAAVQDSLDKLAALDPRDAIEAMLAIDLVAFNAAQRDALHLAVEPAATADQARLQRASAVALHRAFASTFRLLDRQRHRPAAPERDWADAASELTALWRTAPARPLAAPGTGKAADASPAVITKWIDELTDAEVQI